MMDKFTLTIACLAYYDLENYFWKPIILTLFYYLCFMFELTFNQLTGMNPQKIGVLGEDIPASDPDEEQCMIFQEYLLDPSQTVTQILSETGVTVLDFIRLECGEEIQSDQIGSDNTVSVASN